jgi:hypothetical protein
MPSACRSPRQAFSSIGAVANSLLLRRPTISGED